MKVIQSFAFAAWCILACESALAQAYPAKPIHLIVPFPAGGTVDTVARLFAQKLTEAWKQPAIVENRSGAGGNIGAEMVARAAPDGYTLLLSIQSLAISASLYRKLPFDPVKDLAPVSQLTGSVQALVLNSNVAARSVKELVALAKSEPGRLNYASSGLGAPNHLYGELLRSSTGIEVVHVPYKGDVPQLAALLSGEVQMSFMPVFSVYPNIRAGKLRALAVTGGRREGSLPDVPTMIESGVADFDFTGWIGIFAPAATPRDIVNRIGAEAVRIVNLAEVKEPLRARGYETVGSGPDEFAARYRSDVANLGKVVREARVPLVD